MSQFYNCSGLLPDQMKMKNLAISISAIVCCLITVGILLLLIFFRAYKTTIQRFFHYVTILQVVHLALIAMDVELQFDDFSGGHEFCRWLGFLRQWVGLTMYLFVLVITLYMLYLVCAQPRRRASVHFSNENKCRKTALEVMVIVSVVLLPLTFIWVPFKHNAYGMYSAGCWIQKVIDKHCHESKPGEIDQLIFTAINRIMMIIVIMSLLMLSVMFCRLSCHYHQIRKTHLKTVGQTILLMSFFVVSNILEIVTLGMLIYTTVHQKEINSKFWLICHIAMPFSQLIIPLGFLVYLCSFKNFRKHSFKKLASIHCCCCCYYYSCCEKCSGFSLHSKKTELVSPSDHQKERLIESQETATTPSSDHVSQPSETDYKVEYTGGFTDITSSVETNIRHQ